MAAEDTRQQRLRALSPSCDADSIATVDISASAEGSAQTATQFVASPPHITDQMTRLEGRPLDGIAEHESEHASSDHGPFGAAVQSYTDTINQLLHEAIGNYDIASIEPVEQMELSSSLDECVVGAGEYCGHQFRDVLEDKGYCRWLLGLDNLLGGQLFRLRDYVRQHFDPLALDAEAPDLGEPIASNSVECVGSDDGRSDDGDTTVFSLRVETTVLVRSQWSAHSKMLGYLFQGDVVQCTSVQLPQCFRSLRDHQGNGTAWKSWVRPGSRVHVQVPESTMQQAIPESQPWQHHLDASGQCSR
jgi:hypothetical protein